MTFSFIKYVNGTSSRKSEHVLLCGMTPPTRDWPRGTLYVRPASVKWLGQKLEEWSGPTLYQYAFRVLGMLRQHNVKTLGLSNEA